MGTRASFWVGNPMHLDSRKWLGCVAWDGHPRSLIGLENVKTKNDFQKWVKNLSLSRDDFSHPKNGWPFPWDDDIFLTDFTYAFFDRRLWAACFHIGFMTFQQCVDFLGTKNIGDQEDNLPDNVPAPSKYNSKQPDSIFIISR